ncbi:MAG: hypothetical protein AAGC81_07180 [Pseudomonadota bacterium]
MAARGHRAVFDRLVIIVTFVTSFTGLIWFGFAITPKESLEAPSGAEYEARLVAAEVFFERDRNRFDVLQKRSRRAVDRAVEKAKLDRPPPTAEQEEALTKLADEGFQAAFEASKSEALRFRALNYEVEELNAMASDSWAIHIRVRSLIKQQTLEEEVTAYRQALQQIRDDAADRVLCQANELLEGSGSLNSDCLP